MPRRRTSKRAIATGTLAVLLTIVSLWLVIPAVTTVPTSEQHYSGSATVAPSREQILSAMDQFTDPNIVGSGAMSGITGMLEAFPNNTVAEYLGTLSNLSLNMENLKIQTNAISHSLAEGNFTDATENVNGLEGLLLAVGSNINSLRTIVGRLQAQGWNSTKLGEIQHKIDGLERLSDEYSAQVSVLQTQVNLRSPLLRINLSNSSIFIDTTVHANATLLARNGTALVGRSVTISWGTNQVTVTTNKSGSASALLPFQVGFAGGNTVVTASFQPTGVDAIEFVTTYAFALIRVSYYPTEMTAQLDPSRGMPLEYITANGTLTSLSGDPLANRTLVLSLGGIFLGPATTDQAGVFEFNFQIPPSIQSGTQTVLIFFSPREGVLAPANDTLSFTVFRDQTSTQANIQQLLFSGMAMTVSGKVTAASQNPGGLIGNAAVTLDGMSYGTVPVGADGSFSLNPTIPLSAGFGDHTVQITYSPDNPQIAVSQATEHVYVVNSPALLAVALLAAVTPGVLVVRRQRMRAREAVNRSRREAFGVLRGEYPLAKPPNWDKVKELLQAERTPSGLVATSFRLVRTLLSNAIGKRVKVSETHWEFYWKVMASRPLLKEFLNPLVKLFELAEYSPFSLSSAQGEQAKRILIELHDANQI